MRPTRSRALLVTGLLTGAALTILLGSAAGDAIAARRLHASLSEANGASVGGVTFDSARGEVRIDEIVLSLQRAQVRIGRLRVARPPLLALVGIAAAQQAAVVAENVRITVGPITYAAKRIEANGTGLSAADLAALFDPASPSSAAERLDRLTAASIVVPELVVSGAAPLPSVTYRDIRLEGVGKGLIGTASSTGATLTLEVKPGVPISGTIGPMEAKALDLPQILRFDTQTRTDAGEALKPLYQSLSIGGLTLPFDNETTLTIGRMSAQDVRARALATPLTDWPTILQPKPPATAVAPAVIGPMVADYLHSAAFGFIEVRDIKVENTGPKDPGTIRLARFAETGFGDARLGEISIEGLDVAINGIKIKLGRFALRGLDISDGVGAVATIDVTAPNNLRRVAPKLDGVSLTGLDFDVPGQGAPLPWNRVHAALDRFTIDFAGWLNAIPTSVTTTLDGLVMDVPANGTDPNLRPLREAGITRLDLSSKIDVGWVRAGEQIAVREVSLKGAGLGSATMSATIGHVSPDVFATNPAVMQAASLAATLDRADLRIENTGLADTLIALAARNQKQTPAKVRADLVNAAIIGLPQMLGNGPQARAIGAAVAKFVADPKAFHVAAQAKLGLGASDIDLLNDPGQLLGRLDVTVSADN